MPTKPATRVLALDLGTSHIRLAAVDSTGQVAASADLPTLVLMTRQPPSVVAVGDQAAGIGGASLPTGVEALHPVRQGVIAALEPAVALIRAAVQDVMDGERGLLSLRRRPGVVCSLPVTATDAERATILAALRAVGVRTATVVPGAFAAAVGAGLAVQAAQPRLVCDLGAGIVQAVVVRNGLIHAARSWPLGGAWLDRAIVRAVRRRRGIHISPAMAEQARQESGEVAPPLPPVESDPLAARVARRRHLGTGQLMQRVTAGGAFGELAHNPHSVSRLPEFNPEDVRAGLTEGLGPLFEQLAWFWDDLAPEVRTALGGEGLVLTGGLARLPGLADALTHTLHTPARVADDPEGATLRGLVELAAAPTPPADLWPWPSAWEAD